MPRVKKGKKVEEVVENHIDVSDEEVQELMTATEMEGDPTKEASDEREVKWDKLEIFEHSITSEHGPISVDMAKAMIGWETEEEFQQRMVIEKPGSKPQEWVYDEEFHCLNTNKEKVKCHNNGNNRWFDMGWCDHLIQTILRGQWAGPLTYPKETVNGETIRIGRTGLVLSGQHQLTALILASEQLKLEREKEAQFDTEVKHPFWLGREEPVLETIVITGLSEHEDILRTIDYVKPRTVADMLFTMSLFRNETSANRRELTRMLSAAIDTLWYRTKTQGYKTHPEVVGFLERHRTMLESTEHLFAENSGKMSDGGRRISKLNLSAGACVALCYLSGTSGPKTDGDNYRNEKPPSEKNLDWSLWKKAKEFWSRLASDRAFGPVRDRLERLKTSAKDRPDNIGLGGEEREKFAVICKAWHAYKDHSANAGPPFSKEDLKPGGLFHLSYTDKDVNGKTLPDGNIDLLDDVDFLGVDFPYHLDKSKKRSATSIKEPPMPPPGTAEEIEKAKEDALRRRGILPPDELQKKNEEEEVAAKKEEQKKKLAENRKVIKRK